MARRKISDLVLKPWIGMAAIYALTFLAYSNIFHNEFIMDDFDFVVNWPLIRDWGNLPRFFAGYVTPSGQEGVYSPLKTLVHAVNYHLFGLNFTAHHIFSFVNYVLSIYLVNKIGAAFLKGQGARFWATLIFALHPVHVEYVSSITGSVDAVGVTFLFLSFYLYMRAGAGTEQGGRKFYILSLLTAFLSVFLHELCIVLPVLFLWYDACFSVGRLPLKRIMLRLSPFFLVSVVYVLCKYLNLGSITRGEYLYGSFYLTMLVILKAWAKYVAIMVFPITLTFNHVIAPGIYSFGQEDFDRNAVLSQSLLDPQVLISLGVLGALAYIAFKNYKRNRLITFCIGWFFVGLLPGANIVPSGIYFAERYLYAGSLGFCLVFGYGMNRFFETDKKFSGVTCSFWAVFLTVLIVVFCVVRVWVRNLDLRNNITLYESVVRENPYSALMRTDLGVIYAQYKLYDQAIASFQGALKIRSDDPDIYFAMGDAYIDMGMPAQAIESFQKAVAVAPKHAPAHYNLAGLYMKLGQRVKAQAHLEQALSFYREEHGEEEARAWEKAFWDYFGPFEDTL